ncbi:MAG TPA: hypothetical protein VF747_07965 [Blastocatellia bacterium]|jgi:hypothetical protein
MKRCSGCGKLVKFIRSLAGKWIPVNPEMVRVGGEQMLVFADGSVGKSHAKLTFGFITHFATCAKAEFFKGAKPNQARATRQRVAGR